MRLKNLHKQTGKNTLSKSANVDTFLYSRWLSTFRKAVGTTTMPTLRD